MKYNLFNFCLILVLGFVCSLAVSCSDEAEPAANPNFEIVGNWLWTNNDSSGTHTSQTFQVSDDYTVTWTSVFNPDSTPGSMWESWGIIGTLKVGELSGTVTHLTLEISELYVVNSTGVKENIAAVPMNDYSAVTFGATIKGAATIEGINLYMNFNFADENGEYPTEDNLIYHFQRQ